MEIASCSILSNLQLSCTKTSLFTRYLSERSSHDTGRRNSLTFSNFSGNSQIFGKCLRLQRFSSICLSASREDVNPSEELAVILEVDGVMIDTWSSNRQAFNVAFQKLGLDCANWPEPVYSDLLRKGAADEEKMLVLYFNQIGWPSSLPTNEKGTFVKSVLREKKNAINEFLMSKSIPLRSGVQEFIDNACTERVPVAIVTAYCKSGDKVAFSGVRVASLVIVNTAATTVTAAILINFLSTVGLETLRLIDFPTHSVVVLAAPKSWSERNIPPLRATIAKTLYGDLGIGDDDIFVSDGDISRLQVMFGSNVTIAVQDPSYPVIGQIRNQIAGELWKNSEVLYTMSLKHQKELNANNRDFVVSYIKKKHISPSLLSWSCNGFCFWTR